MFRKLENKLAVLFRNWSDTLNEREQDRHSEQLRERFTAVLNKASEITEGKKSFTTIPIKSFDARIDRIKIENDANTDELVKSFQDAVNTAPREQLMIQILGTTASGKSTVAAMIRDCLQSAGFQNVAFVDDTTYQTAKYKFDMKLDEIKNKFITIKTQPLSRQPWTPKKTTSE